MIKIKKYILGFLLLELIFAYTSAYAQNNTSYDYSQGGTNPVSSQIEKYLCAPSPVITSQTSNTLTWWAGMQITQQQAAANNANGGDLYRCINQLYKLAIVVACVIGVGFIVIAGYIYMSANGEAESVTKAKNILETTIVSIVILLVGYVLLKAINPDLIQFQPIQPPSVVLAPSGAGNITPGTPVSGTYITPNSTVTDLQGSGCAFQTDTQKNEAPQMAPQLEQIVKSICYNIVKQNNGNQYPGTQGSAPTISSIIGVGQHATNSYHYKGCAVDFAAGNSNFVNTPMGKAIIQEAKNNGISASRINPGTDATRTDMVHIDLGTSCPNSTNVNPNVVE